MNSCKTQNQLQLTMHIQIYMRVYTSIYFFFTQQIRAIRVNLSVLLKGCANGKEGGGSSFAA